LNILEVAYWEQTSIVENSDIGKGTIIRKYCNIYNSTIGKNCKIASYVEIGGATIGDGCKIEAYTFIPPGVTIGNNVFIGPHVVFTNDKWPRVTIVAWKPCETVVEDGVSIGANSTILSGITIRENAMIGAGSLIAKSVLGGSLVYGDEAKERGTVH